MKYLYLRTILQTLKLLGVYTCLNEVSALLNLALGR